MTVRGLQAACDSLVSETPATPLRIGKLLRSQTVPISSDVSSLLDGDYDPATGDVWVLDRARPAVVAIDSAGKEVRQWGQKGNGPGDLFVLPWPNHGHKIALVGDQVLALDQYRLSRFTKEGRFRDLSTVTGNPLSIQRGVSIFATSDSTALFGVLQSRIVMDTSAAARATVRFFRVNASGRRLSIDTLFYSLSSKDRYNSGYNRVGVPLYNKFGFEMGETWAVSRGALVALSFQGFGFCRIDPSSGTIRSAVHVAGEPRPTSNAERLQVHVDYPGIDERNPDGTVWGEELDAHWPPTAPWYEHIVAGKHLIAASRSASIRDDQVDLFIDDAYRGSFPSPQGWLQGIVAVDGDSLLREEEDTTTSTLSLAWYHMALAP